MIYVNYNLIPIVDDDGIATATAGETSFPLNGDLASKGVVTFEHPHKIVIDSDATDTGTTYTIKGEDALGRLIIFTQLGGDTGTPTVSDAYVIKITEITSDVGCVGNVEIGTNGVAATKWIFNSMYDGKNNVGFGIIVAAGSTLTYTPRHTFANIKELATNELNIERFTHPLIGTTGASADGNYMNAFSLFRIELDTYTAGSLKFEVRM